MVEVSLARLISVRSLPVEFGKEGIEMWGQLSGEEAVELHCKYVFAFKCHNYLRFYKGHTKMEYVL